MGLSRRYPWPTMRLSHRRLIGIFLVIAGAAPFAASREAALDAAVSREQAQSREFTAEDMLKVSTASVVDLSDDGRRAAVAVRRAYDNAEVDNRRFGDPTYIAPSQVKLLVVDTTSGATDTVFRDLANVRQAAWSHVGRRLVVVGGASGVAA